MIKTLFICLVSLITLILPNADTGSAEGPFVREIISGLPTDLDSQTLLVPRYDMIDMEQVMPPQKRKWAMGVNRSAKSGNTIINDIFEEKYPYEYKMANLHQIEKLKAEGYRYFLDLVWMPKQMKSPKREAMKPAFERFDSANRMFSNRNSQIHYYFYIRDLETNDVYITSGFKGNADAYTGMKKFIGQIKKEQGL